MRRGGLSRREILQGGGIAVMGAGGLTLAGIAGYAWPHSTEPAAAASIPAAPVTPPDARGVLHFVTRPDLTPPALTVAHHDRAGGRSPEYFILAPAGYPRTGPGVPGLMILDRRGGIVWYSPNTGFPASTGAGRMDLKVQAYRGQPVLTWWEGQVVKGYGEGKAVIADTSYRTIATIKAGNGLQADLHEFVISPQDTALITAYRQLGGKQSSFQMGPGATFWFQHHITPLDASTVSIFDDGGAPPQKEAQSRAILLDLDTGAMKATLKQSYTHPAGLAAANQGSMQVLDDGRVLVGWGNLPYFSEFAADGTLLLDGQFPVGDQSYRAFTADWAGHPADKPAAAARVNPAGGSVVYASWNGSTELDTWTVLAGKTADALAKAGYSGGPASRR